MTESTEPFAFPRQLQVIRQRINATAPLESLMQELARQQAAIDDMALKLRLLRAQQSLGEVLLPTVDVAYEGLDSAHLDAGMPLDPQKGFYAIEHDGNGHPFRWTGPTPVFSFDLHLDRRAPLLVTMLTASSSGSTSNDVRSFSDGIELPLSRSAVAGGVNYSVILLGRAMPGITRLSFLVKKMFKPEPAQIDKRTLGIIFRHLDVQPATNAQAQRFLQAADDLLRARLEPVAPASDLAALVTPETALEPLPDAEPDIEPANAR